MSIAPPLSPALRPRREKMFGAGRPHGLDREAKVRIMTRARALSRRTEKGKHYGIITAKALDVLEALLWGFHNARSGLCFPSYTTIAEKAKCARSTVAQAIKALEAAGILSWVNRILRVREKCLDVWGESALRWRIIRTSNAYHFKDNPGKTKALPPCNSCKSEFPPETSNQVFITSSCTPELNFDPKNPVNLALQRLGRAIGLLPEEGAAKASSA